MIPIEIIYLFAFIALGALTGFASANLSRALDFGMDYGHFIDWLRLRMVRKAAEKTGQIEMFETELKRCLFIDNFGDRVNSIDLLYWRIANKAKGLTLWLCAVCLSFRLNAVINIALIAAYSLLFGFTFLVIPFIFISGAFNEYFIR